MLYAPVGKGAYIFSAYDWFRELPAGVPGAYRMFANMLSAAKNPVTEPSDRPQAVRRAAAVSRHLEARLHLVVIYLACVIALFYWFTKSFARLAMRPLDWVVMFGWLVFLVSYGLWRGRGSGSTQEFMLAGKTMPWYAMGLSIMATQASAITFISTTAQAYVDGMRFVQFYFGLPLAMVILSATAVPIFHRAKVYTAYEYLEHRFDAKTAPAGHHHLSDLARPGRGARAVGSGHRAVRGPGLAVPRDHPHHGRAGRALHHHWAGSRRSPGPTCSRWR